MAAPKHIWNPHVFTPTAQRWQIRGAAKTGGSSLSGLIQAARTEGGGYWLCELIDVSLRTADQIRAWRAMELVLDGGATPVLVQMCDPRQRPTLLVDGVEVKSHTVPHIDAALNETTFSDDSSYESLPIVASVNLTNIPAALRATTMDIDCNAALRGGEHFSIDHPGQSHRLYRVRTIESVAGNVQRITFRPPLREAVTTQGTRVEFNNPLCVMRVADPDQMSIAVELFQRATGRVTFVEHFGIIE